MASLSWHADPERFAGISGGEETSMAVAKPMERQVGGGHYAKYAIQPTDFIHKNGLGFIQGNIIKYVVRYKDKGGVEDLRKARHYLDMLIASELGD